MSESIPQYVIAEKGKVAPNNALYNRQDLDYRTVEKLLNAIDEQLPKLNEKLKLIGVQCVDNFGRNVAAEINEWISKNDSFTKKILNDQIFTLAQKLEGENCNVGAATNYALLTPSERATEVKRAELKKIRAQLKLPEKKEIMPLKQAEKSVNNAPNRQRLNSAALPPDVDQRGISEIQREALDEEPKERIVGRKPLNPGGEN